MNNLMTGMEAWLRFGVAAFAVNLLIAFLILVAGIILARLAAEGTTRSLTRIEKLSAKRLLVNFLARTAKLSVLVLAVILAVGQVGIDVMPLVAGIGVLGFVVGFAFKDSLSNLAAGLLLLFYQPFDQGDFVEAGGQMGTVMDMHVAATELRAPDGRLIVMPNGRIWNAPIINFNKLGQRRIEWKVGVSYGSDIGATLETLQEVVETEERILTEPAPHFVVDELADSSVNFVVRAWVVPKDFLGVTSDTRRRFKEALDARGLEIPFPHRVIVHPDTPSSNAA
jgi:small conductance mechanosensitive channel